MAMLIVYNSPKYLYMFLLLSPQKGSLRKTFRKNTRMIIWVCMLSWNINKTAKVLRQFGIRKSHKKLVI